MNDITPRKINTGSDPRTLPDYAALRDELAKLSHPARPDVNWRYAEKLCLSLFEQNGVELQTAAWYTLARTQLAGLFGLNEGLAILDALISHQWGALWPQPVHARMDILSGLSQRIQQMMRTLPLSYSDLSQLYRAEQLLTSLSAVLQRLELKHLSQFDALRTLMYSSAARLENSDGPPSTGAAIEQGKMQPAAVTSRSGMSKDTLSGMHIPVPNESVDTVKWVYVAQSEPQPNIAVLTPIPASIKPWKSFAAGMCTMLVLGAVTIGGWQALHRPDPLQAQLTASLAPLPTTLTSAQRADLRQQVLMTDDVMAQTQRQLIQLAQLSPDWNVDYSRQLVKQAQALWSEQAKPLAQQWQQQVNASLLSTENLNGWHQGMMALKQLSDRLNALDEQKGKYMTVSELKSAVFSMMTDFQRTEPAEEQLRLLQLPPADPAQRSQRIQKLEQHLRSQIYTLAQEKYRDGD